jgi:hypothetical protein
MATSANHHYYDPNYTPPGARLLSCAIVYLFWHRTAFLRSAMGKLLKTALLPCFELAAAQVAGKPACTVTPACDGTSGCNYFYCPAAPGATNTAAGSDYWKLGQLGWTL